MEREVHGDRSHPDIARLLYSIGNVLRKQGDLAGALSKYEESLAMKREVHGDRPHPDIARSLNNVGDVLRQRDGERVVEQFPRVVPRREMTCVCVASGQQQGVFSPFGEPSPRDGRICLH